MAYRLKFSGRAVREIGEAFDWYEEQSKGLGSEFELAFELQLKRLEQVPLSYPEIVPNVRRTLLPRFPYGVFYTVKNDTRNPLSGGCMTESWYERTILPYLLDISCGMKPIREQRMKVIPLATGRVLEIGIGTGLNLPFYDRARIKSIVGVDPGLQMHKLALKRSVAAGIKVELVGVSAEKIPVADATFETVVSTYTLCTIPDPVAALKELRRALVPGGKLLFSEHGRAPDEGVQRWQTRLQPYWMKIAGGCRMNRDIPALLEEAGFKPQVQSRYIPGPRVLSYHFWGEAVAA